MSEPAARIRLSSVGFALLLLSPLVWAPGYGYDGVRLPLFLALVTLLLGRRAFRGGGRRGPAPLLTAALILVAANALSLAVARSPGEAAVPLLILCGGVALFSVIREGSVDREFVLEGVPILLAIVGLVLAAIGVYQRLSELPVVSTEGNSNYSGALAGMLFPVLAAEAAAGRRRWLCGLSAAALLALLILSESRGGWLGAVAGTGVAAGALLWKRSPGARTAGIAIVCLVVIPVALQAQTQLSQARSGGVTYRIEAWKGALRMLAARPILGAGPGNFAVEYPLYRSEVEFRASHVYAPAGAFKEAEDAHSIWAQAAAETGALGLLALLLVVYVAARLWRYHVKAAVEPEAIALLAGLGGGAAAFLVAGLFNTLTLHVSHALLFWAFLGMIERVGGTEGRGRSGPALPLAASLAGLFGTFLAGSLAVSDREFTAGMSQRDPAVRATRLERAAQAHPAPWRARHELARALAALGRLPEAIAAARETLRLRPHSVPALNQLAALVVEKDEDEAERRFRRAIEVAPHYYQSYFNLGSLQLKQRRVAAAREQFALSVECNARHAPSEFSLGETYALAGDPAAALAHFRRARELGLDSGAVLRREHPGLAADPRYVELYR